MTRGHGPLRAPGPLILGLGLLALGLAGGGAGQALAKKAKKAGRAVAKQKAAPSGDAQALLDAGLEAYKQKRYAEALAGFEASYRLDPAPSTLYNIAKTHGRSGNTEQGIAAFERFVKDHPQHNLRPEAEANLGELRQKAEEDRAAQALSQGRFDEAQAALKALYRLRPRPRTLLQLAEAQRQAGRLAEAIKSYERALGEELSIDQRDQAEKAIIETKSLYEEARAGELSAAGQHAEAARALETAMRLRPSPRLLFALGKAQGQAGRYRDALSSFERFLKETRDGREAGLADKRQEIEGALVDLRARALDERAAELYREGQREQAIAAWKEAIRMKPLPAFVFRLARAHRMAGQPDLALARFEECLRQKEALSADERIETESAVVELSEAREGRKALRERGRPPLWKRPWFIAVMSVLAAGVGTGVGLSAAAASGLTLSRSGPVEPATDLGGTSLSFPPQNP